MRNKNATTQSPAHLDEIQVGCIIDGSHQHPEDFSVAIVRYGETLGYEIDDKDLVHVLIRETGMIDRLPYGVAGEVAEHLSELSDEVVNWLNEHVCDDAHAFHVEESDLFLSPVTDLEAESEDDGPWKYVRSE